MKHAMFILKHAKSDSSAFLECHKIDGKIKITAVAFTKGNVIELESVRAAINHADNLLL